MATPEEMAATMRTNVPEKTGHPMKHWFGVLGGAGLEKHGQMVRMLKTDHGVTHAMVGPATKSQVEVSFNLKGKDSTDRLKSASGMATHKVRLSAPDEVNDEVAGWLKEAYEGA